MRSLRRHSILFLSLLGILAASPTLAFVLHTSAHVEIVPGVDILRVGTALPGSVPVEAADRSGSAGFYVDGPADRTVRVAWTILPRDGAVTPASTSASRHDEGGGLMLDCEFGADAADEPLDGYLLTLEYE